MIACLSASFFYGSVCAETKPEVENFKKEYKVPYPIFTDPGFVAHKMPGNPPAPYTIFVMRDARGKYIVVSTHKGKFDSVESIMNEIREQVKVASMKNKLEEIIAVLQLLDNNTIWNLTCMCEGFTIISVHINPESGKILKFEKKSLFDMVKKT